MGNQQTEQFNRSPQHSPGWDTPTPTGPDIDEVLVLYNNTSTELAVGSRKRRTTQTQPASRGSGQTRPFKRRHQSASQDIDQELDDVCPAAVQVKNREDDDTPTPLFACPFYKKDRHKYHLCLGYHLRRIKDVKQHIYRKHSKPEFYCSRCFCVFNEAPSRDAHTRLASCEIRTDPSYDGISSEQKKVLAQYANRSKQVREQWFEIWDTIFPYETKPASAYVDGYYEEMVPRLRAFWESRQPEFISKVILANDVRNTIGDTLNQVIGAFFDHFEKEILGFNMEQPTEPVRRWPGVDLNRSHESAFDMASSPLTPPEFQALLPADLKSYVTHQNEGRFSISANEGHAQFLANDEAYRSFFNDPTYDSPV